MQTCGGAVEGRDVVQDRLGSTQKSPESPRGVSARPRGPPAREPSVTGRRSVPCSTPAPICTRRPSSAGSKPVSITRIHRLLGGWAGAGDEYGDAAGRPRKCALTRGRGLKRGVDCTLVQTPKSLERGFVRGFSLLVLVVRGRVELPTFRFSVHRSWASELAFVLVRAIAGVHGSAWIGALGHLGCHSVRHSGKYPFWPARLPSSHPPG